MAVTVEEFTEVYIKKLTEACLKHPDEYMFTSSKVPEVVGKMMVAIVRGNGFMVGPALKATCKELGIKGTAKEIHDSLRASTE